MSNAPKIKKCDTINIHGTDFVGYKGLIDHAHQCGMKSLNTEILQFPNTENNETVIVKCTVRTNDDTVYTSIGDANPSNVNPSCAFSYIRVAETRAKSRAISDAYNVKNSIEDDCPESLLSAHHGDQDYSNNQSSSTKPASTKQLNFASNLIEANGHDPDKYIRDTFNKQFSDLTYYEADKIIKSFRQDPEMY